MKDSETHMVVFWGGGENHAWEMQWWRVTPFDQRLVYRDGVRAKTQPTMFAQKKTTLVDSPYAGKVGMYLESWITKMNTVQIFDYPNNEANNES